MILEKFDKGIIKFDPYRTYGQEVGMKPKGMWVSVKGDDDWPEWVKNEGFRPDLYNHRHIVKVDPEWDILHIKTVEELKAFHAEFGAAMHPGLDLKMEHIDWARVADNYDGIIIAPYQWEARLDDVMFWYYSWDVASGCIWNLEAIDSVTYKGLVDYAEVGA